MSAVTACSNILYKKEGDYMEKTNKGKMNWELIRIEFVRQRECKTLKSFCEMKGYNYGYLKQIAAKEGWVKQRKRWQCENSESNEKTDEINLSRAMGDKLLISTLPALMDAWDELINAAANRNIYRNSEGEFSAIKFNRIMQSFELLLNNIKSCTFFLDAESRAKVDIAYQQLEMKKRRQNEDDGEIVDDNFLQALETASKLVWNDDGKDGK